MTYLSEQLLKKQTHLKYVFSFKMGIECFLELYWVREKVNGNNKSFFKYYTKKVELQNKDVEIAHVCSVGSTACMKS